VERRSGVEVKVKVEVSLRGTIEVEVPDARTEAVRNLVLPVSLEQFEEVSGVKTYWDTTYVLHARIEVGGVHFPKADLPAGEVPLRPSIHSIMLGMSAHYGVKPEDLKGPGRWYSVSRPRMVAMYMARKMTGASFPLIGKCFGGRDHSTVIHAVRKIETLLLENAELREAVAAVEQFIRRNLS
jgi:chromosomal replication initiator protein